MLDPEIVAGAGRRRSGAEGELTADEDDLLQQVAEGTAGQGDRRRSGHARPEAVNDAIEALFLQLAEGASAGREGALRRLRLLQKAIVDREEQGETLSRFLPGGLAEKLAHRPGGPSTAPSG